MGCMWIKVGESRDYTGCIGIIGVICGDYMGYVWNMSYIGIIWVMLDI